MMDDDKKKFDQYFKEISSQLKSYLYRMVTNMYDTEDLLQDTFIKGFENFHSFDPKLASFKTWTFTIASNLAINHLKKKKRWKANSHDTAKSYLRENDGMKQDFVQIIKNNQDSVFDMREHIGYCFNCLTKVLPIEQQIALILKDIYNFKVKEIGQILNKTFGVTKHLLLNARKKMTDIFDHDCSLINKDGVCYKCSELNQIFNPKQKAEEALRKIELKNDSSSDNKTLYNLRTQLVKALDPTKEKGKEIHEFMYHLNQVAQGDK